MIASVDARSGALVADVAEETTAAELESVCEQAVAASRVLEGAARPQRAGMLAAMADALERRAGEIVALADRETALGEARLTNELARTCGQLRFFGSVITEGAYLEATIDHPRPGPAGPQPDLRRILKPLGPVAVFGASNFPLAFSVPGGDTASALAAGCSVIVKAHDAHPATSVLCASALSEGALQVGVRAPVVALVFGQAAGVGLVQHPSVKAIGFTGSLGGGRHLFDLANQRPSPVPFYGELGALNAVVVGPAAAATRAGEIAKGLVASFNLSVGQFCTKPGLVLLPEGGAGDAVRDQLALAVRELAAGFMLSERIAASFTAGSARLQALPGVKVVAAGRAPSGPGWWGTPLVLEAEPAALGGALAEECFGPVLAVVRYGDGDGLVKLVGKLQPALTATVQAEPADEHILVPALEAMTQKAGRVVWNGYPTGVAVTWAMHHGGPYPATTDPLHTSVGAAAIRRWLRPVAYQDVPQHLLPAELRDDPGPGYGVPRRVDGQLALPAG